MSSHHFVREDQEPALLILDAGVIPFSKAQELLEWSPTVLVDYDTWSVVQGWGIKVDVIIAPEAGKNTILASLQEQGPLKWIWSQPDDDKAALAFHFLLATRQRYVNVVGNLHHNAQQLTTVWSDRLHITWLKQNQRWVWVPAGSLDKWLPRDTTYWCTDENGIHEFRTNEDGLVQIKYAGPFWFVEEL